MEVVAGDSDLNVEIKECKALFRFNFAEVYWNSRLQMEHLRVVQSMNPEDVICAYMAHSVAGHAGTQARVQTYKLLTPPLTRARFAWLWERFWLQVTRFAKVSVRQNQPMCCVHPQAQISEGNSGPIFLEA